MQRICPLLLLVPLWWAACTPGADTATPRKAVLMSFDGFPADLFQQPLVRENMPTLVGLVEEKGVALRSRPSFPSNTATSHSALWTGAWGGVSGITGNWVLEEPGGEHTFLETRSGFSSFPLRAEPAFVTTARQGLETLVVAATQTYPFERLFQQPGLSAEERAKVGRNLTLFNLYDGRLGRSFLVTRKDLRPADEGGLAFQRPFSLELSREPGSSPRFGRRWEGRLGGRWFASGEEGLNRLRLEVEPPSSEPGGGFSIEVDTAGLPFVDLPFRLWGIPAAVSAKVYAADPSGSDFLLFLHNPNALLSSDPDLAELLAGRLKSVEGNGAAFPYRRGQLGTLLAGGGDGLAEERYLESVLHLIERSRRLWTIATTEREWQVAFSYLPYPDEMLHEWYGWLAPSSPAHDPEVAKRMRPLAARVFSALDGYLGEVLTSLGPDGLLILGSDHGMRPATRMFYPNRLLRQAGLLHSDSRGRIDAARSRARYLDTFAVALNTLDYAQGTVPDDEIHELRRRIADLLSAARDPETGEQIVDRVVLPGTEEGLRWGVGGPASGHVFFDVRPHYYASRSTAAGPIAAPVQPMGAHGYHPDHEDMHALMVLAGPGLARLRESRPTVRNIDAAPTLCDWLGIAPPRHATGRSLGKD